MKMEEETITNRIAQLMNKEGHTINTFARKLNISWTSANNIITGRNAPNYETIVKILTSFENIDANWLIMGQERRTEKAFRDYWSRYIRTNLNLTDRYKFYSLKDTGITNMLRANTDILTVRDQARHSSILITDIYTPKDIQQANQLLLNYKGVL